MPVWSFTLLINVVISDRKTTVGIALVQVCRNYVKWNMSTVLFAENNNVLIAENEKKLVNEFDTVCRRRVLKL